MMNYLDRYLAGEAPLHAERLRVPTDGELDAAEAAFDQLVAKRKARTVSMRWRWMAAACLLLIIIGIGATMLTDRISPQEDIGADDMAQTLPSLHGEGSGVGPVTSTTTETVIEKHQQRELKATGRRAQLGNKAAGRRLKAVNPSLQEDTLGSGIWQSERNVMRAMQMLSECEAIIEKSEREVRNSIVRATFNAVPQPATAVLVTDELGDCYVSDTNRQTVIEL